MLFFNLMLNESYERTKTVKRSLFVSDPSRSDRDRRARIYIYIYIYIHSNLPYPCTVVRNWEFARISEMQWLVHVQFQSVLIQKSKTDVFNGLWIILDMYLLYNFVRFEFQIIPVGSGHENADRF